MSAIDRRGHRRARRGRAALGGVRRRATSTIVLLPTWSIMPSRFWKLQVPTLARRHRVVTFDGRGTGRSGRPAGGAAPTPTWSSPPTSRLCSTPPAQRPPCSSGCRAVRHRAVQLAADHPERARGLVAIGPAVPLAPAPADRRNHSFEDAIADPEGWAEVQRSRTGCSDFEQFLEFFFRTHVHRAALDEADRGLRRRGRSRPTPRVLGATPSRALDDRPATTFPRRVRASRCPVLVIHGDDDEIRPTPEVPRSPSSPGARCVTIDGGGHGPHGRDPIRVNRRDRASSSTTVASRRDGDGPGLVPRAVGRAGAVPLVADRARPRPPRRRHRRTSCARCHPDLQIDWLAQHPVTTRARDARRARPPGVGVARQRVGAHRGRGGRARPPRLPGDPADGRDPRQQLHACSTTWSSDEHYDLVIGDEAWDVDYFLHENPELKRFAFAWMTDFVGWLPMPDGGDARGRADRRLQRRDDRAAGPLPARPRPLDLRRRSRRHRARRVRRRGCPSIREWTEANFDFAGYVTGFDAGRGRRPGGAARASSATAPTSRCAS